MPLVLYNCTPHTERRIIVRLLRIKEGRKMVGERERFSRASYPPYMTNSPKRRGFDSLLGVLLVLKEKVLIF